MARGKKRLRLKKNMEALMAKEAAGEVIEDVALKEIRPNPYQPRRSFDQEALAELADSIQKSGVFQPVILRQPDPKLSRYELIAGERRFRADQ